MYKVINFLTLVYSMQNYVKCLCHTQKSGLSFSGDFMSKMRHQKWLTIWDQFVWAGYISPLYFPLGSGVQLVKVLIMCLPHSKCGCLAGYSSQDTLMALRRFLALTLRCSGVINFEPQGLAHLFWLSFKEGKESWTVVFSVNPGYQLLFVGKIK